jgi:hypothetical protein
MLMILELTGPVEGTWGAEVGSSAPSICVRQVGRVDFTHSYLVAEGPHHLSLIHSLSPSLLSSLPPSIPCLCSVGDDT